MNAPAACLLLGRWRIIEADLWDRAHLEHFLIRLNRLGIPESAWF